MISQTTETIENSEIAASVVEQYLPKIKYYAHKMSMNLPTELSEDDLVSAGVLGLLEAIRRYDDSREASLKTFSDYRIKGAIIDEIRSMQWTPRDLKKKLSAVKETYINLESELLRTPLDNEVAEKLGISVNALRRVFMAANMSNISSLHDLVTGKDGETKEIIDFILNKEDDPSELFELKDYRKRLVRAIDALSQREKIIITLYYYKDLTLKEIGAVVGLTESRVCQVLNEAHLKLRESIDQVSSFKDI